jgi:hypothetical protein
MACSGAYATPADFNQYWCLSIDLTDADTVAEINRMLTLAAADLHGPLSAVGACNCLTAWGLEYLRKLNVVETGVFYRCSCGPTLTEGERRLYLEWLDRQMELIRASKLDLCGFTGAEYPAFGSVELNLTAFNEARIIANRIQRTP